MAVLKRAPDFEVVEKVLNSPTGTAPDDEKKWLDHYLELADKALRPPPAQLFLVPKVKKTG